MAGIMSVYGILGHSGKLLLFSSGTARALANRSEHAHTKLRMDEDAIAETATRDSD